MMQVEIIGDGQCPSPEPKVYVLVRRDLPWPVRCVQAMHAVMQLTHDIGYKVGWGLNGPAVVLLGIKDEAELTDWLIRLNDNDSTPWPVSFKEPDLNNQLTAVCYYGQPIEELSELKLM